VDAEVKQLAVEIVRLGQKQPDGSVAVPFGVLAKGWRGRGGGSDSRVLTHACVHARVRRRSRGQRL
jgi:hypothetical protein